jgi:hypothetical protein
VRSDLGCTVGTKRELASLRQSVAADHALTEFVNHEVNEIYFYQGDRYTPDNVAVKMYPPHCTEGRCDVCHKLEFRLVPAYQEKNGLPEAIGVDAVPCHAQAPDYHIPIIRGGEVLRRIFSMPTCIMRRDRVGIWAVTAWVPDTQSHSTSDS